MKSGIWWAIGMIVRRGRRVRAKSFDVAHARSGRRFLCGRPMVVRWAGYKKARIVELRKAAGYERRCKRCAHCLRGARG